MASVVIAVVGDQHHLGEGVKVLDLFEGAQSNLLNKHHFQAKLGNFDGTFREFIRDEEASGYGYNYVGWLKSWLEASNSTSVHVLKYEILNRMRRLPSSRSCASCAWT